MPSLWHQLRIPGRLIGTRRSKVHEDPNAYPRAWLVHHTGVLVWSEVCCPGWRAAVNRQPAEWTPR